MESVVNVLKLTKISKVFPGAETLTDVDLTVGEGEVLVLVGENGAERSTLMKILPGTCKKDGGTIEFEGREVEIHLPKQSEELGISTIYQELNLIQKVTVVEDVFLGRYLMKMGAAQWKKMREDAKRLFGDLGTEMDTRATFRELSLAQQRIVEIVKTVDISVKVVIMGEPTPSLFHNETEILFRIIRMLKERGTVVTFITHRLDEIYTIRSRMIALRDGCYIGTREVREATKVDMIGMTIRRQLTNQYPQRDTKIGKMALGVQGLSDGGKRVKEVLFVARSSEVPGFAGLVGVERTETMRTIFGVNKGARGKIFIDGKQVSISSLKDVIDMGTNFITENRKEEGLLLRSSVRVGAVMVALKKILKAGFYFDFKKEKQVAEEYVELLHTAASSVEQRVIFLNGGSQRKVVLVRRSSSGSKIITSDEPARGIDVGAKRKIYEIINKLVLEDKTAIVAPSDLEEIMGICDRILVVHEGVISGEVEKTEFSQSKIAEYAIGGS